MNIRPVLSNCFYWLLILLAVLPCAGEDDGEGKAAEEKAQGDFLTAVKHGCEDAV